MTSLLASVRNFSEAQTALTVPLGVLDLKEPGAGALGAVDAATVEHCVQASNGHCPISTTIGDLPPDPKLATRSIEKLLACKVDYIKIGFFTPHYLQTYPASLKNYTQTVQLIAVLFADRIPELEGPVELLAYTGFRGVMLDTANKQTGTLLDCVSPTQLAAFVAGVKSTGMLCGLAGSLREQDIAKLTPLAPDYLGFRTALCENENRNQGLSVKKLRQVYNTLQQAQ